MIGPEDTPEFIGQIIDVFEDFLESKGIDIPNVDKEQSGGSAAILYGMDYGWLQSELEAMMDAWGVIKLRRNNNPREVISMTEDELAMIEWLKGASTEDVLREMHAVDHEILRNDK